jgi:hypothetical protein
MSGIQTNMNCIIQFIAFQYRIKTSTDYFIEAASSIIEAASH